jgi:hypothetical protein
MSIGDAFSSTTQGPVGLQDFRDTVVVSGNLILGGHWILFARVVIVNHDSDGQDATVKLAVGTPDGSMLLDQVDIRLSGDPNPEVVTLQAYSLFLESPTVTVTCATFKGAAQQISLIGLMVGDPVNG